MKKLLCIVLTILIITISILPVYAKDTVSLVSVTKPGKDKNVWDKIVLEKEKPAKEKNLN